MSNIDNPRGFWPIRHLAGGVIRTEEFIVTTGQIVYAGDLLKCVDAGTVEIAAADAGVIVIGVAAEYVNDSGSAGGKKVRVFADPYIAFGVQADSGTAPAATAVFSTANHVATTGNTTTKISLNELDASDIETGGQLEVLGIVDAPDNAWGEHVDLVVRIAEHKWNAAVAGL
jgi:hypothetical protein